MNCYTFDEFIEQVYKPRDYYKRFAVIDLYETLMQYNRGVVLSIDGEEFKVVPHSQEVIKECSPEMNDFINCFAQGVAV